MAPSDEAMEERQVIRLTDAEMARLRRIAGPIPRALVAREALRIGLDFFETHREALFRIEPRRAKPARKPRAKRRRPHEG